MRVAVARPAPGGPQPNVKRGAGELLIGAGFVYIGAVVPLPQYVGGRFAGFGLQLLVAGWLAFVGWSRAGRIPAGPVYMVPALMMGAWAFVSAVAAWNSGTLYETVTFMVWLLFIIPGLAYLLRDRNYRNAILTGFGSGLVVYGTTVVYRKLQGRSALDITENNLEGTGLILNQNRSLVSMCVLVVMSYLLLKRFPAGPRLQYLRWPMVALGGTMIILSGGRSALLGLAAFLLLMALLRPGVGTKVRRTVTVGLIGVTFVMVTQAMGGEVARSTDRIVGYFGEEKDDSDKARDLVTRKAWNLALDHPAFGVGFQNFLWTYHPVVEEAENSNVRYNVGRLIAHNTYALVMAEMGFPGLLFFALTLGSVMLGCVRRIDAVDARCAAAGFGAVLLMISFDHVLGMVLYLPMALALSAQDAQPQEPEPAVTPVESVVR